ncbi:MAG: response regulator transcription factor, partial [Dehalococcoidia bacterium]
LSSAGHEPVVVHDSARALDRLRKSPVELAIIELILPQDSGIELCRHIRSDPGLAQTRILVVSALHSISDKVGAFHAGADDYLTKPFDMAELECRVEALLRRSLQASSRQMLRLISLHVDSVFIELDKATFMVHVDGRRTSLTPTEFDLLRCLMEKAGTVVSHEGLLMDVWGYQNGTGDPELVRAHIKNLRSKLAGSSRTRKEIIRTTLRRGYMIPFSTSH